MGKITYEESTPISGSDSFDNSELADGVEIRQQDVGVLVYAVFDNEDRVSPTEAPNRYASVLAFAQGYSKAKEEYKGDQ